MFLERAEGLRALEESLDAVRARAEGRLVLVAGEAGVGKTALIRRFCESQSGSARVCWGTCEALLTPRPLGPFLDVAENVGGEVEELVRGVARPHEVAAALMRELRRRPATVVVLEDLHWADEATLDVLTLLGRRIETVPALVVASFRDDELGRAQLLRVVLGELVGRPRRLKIEPLSPAAVGELAAPYAVDAVELYSRTAGNPFFVTEVLGGGGEQIPETIRDAVFARVARLPMGARRLLEAVAIVRGHADMWLLEKVAGDLVGYLEDCIASGMVTTGPRHVAFRHELARLAVEDAIAPDRRLALHRAALDAIADRTKAEPDLVRLAYHAEAAGDPEAVLRWAPQAAVRAALSGSHREAAAQYARALRFAAWLPPVTRAELFERRADECYMTDQFDEAIEAQNSALEYRRSLGDLLGEGNSLRALSRLLRYVGRTSEAEQAGRAAIELLERVPAGHELAIAYCNLSHLSMNMEDADATRSWASRAIELARRFDDTDALVYAQTNIGVVELQADVTGGRERLEAVLDVAQRAGLEEPAGRAFLSLVLWPVRQRSYPLAERYVEAGLEYCTERGLDTWRLYLLACRARLELDRGQWDRAAASAELVLRDPRSAPVPRGWALAALSVVRARRGDPQAAAPLAEARALAQPTGELQRIAPAAVARAEAAWLNGEQSLVAPETDAALGLALQRRAAWVVGELACWRWRAGVLDDLPAGAAAEPYALSMAGEWRRAAERWKEIGCPYEAALALADADAEQPLREALVDLQALGARPAAAIVARRLRVHGVRGLPRGPYARTRGNPAGLTARELEVVLLVADGLRNAQIAERLVVSEKTVSHHVSAILRKLSVGTRGEAAVEAVRLGLAGPIRSLEPGDASGRTPCEAR